MNPQLYAWLAIINDKSSSIDKNISQNNTNVNRNNTQNPKDYYFIRKRNNIDLSYIIWFVQKIYIFVDKTLKIIYFFIIYLIDKKLIKWYNIYRCLGEQWYASVAQLDRVTDYESVGRRFESCRAYKRNGLAIRLSRFLFLDIFVFL